MVAKAPRKGVQTPDASIAPAVAAGLVFVASGTVLVLEILAVRLLAPYVGLTLETTTSIIGAALAGIAVGAALGGVLADRVDSRRLLAYLLAGGGLLTLLTVPIVRALGPGARDASELGTLGITLLALVPAAAVLSAVSPTVARLRLHDLHRSGTIVGGISAWATAGALVGTFGTGFVLVPLMPVSTAVLAIGIALVLAGILYGLRTRLLGLIGLTGIVAATLAFALLTVTVHTPCDKETSYHCVRVLVDPARASGRILVLDDQHHSYVDVRDPKYLNFIYVRWIAHAIDAIAGAHAPLHALFVGGGGFTLPRWLEATHPGARSHVLEVDGDLLTIARERLALHTSPALQVTIGDARMTLRHVPSAGASVVVGDAFGNSAVPWHLTTREWTQEIRRVMRPGGLYALNLIDMRPLGFLRAEAATLLDAFAHVEIIAFPGADLDPAGGNAVLLASDRPLPRRAASDGALTYSQAEVVRIVAGAEPLRDDFAPVDQLMTPPS